MFHRSLLIIIDIWKKSEYSGPKYFYCKNEKDDTSQNTPVYYYNDDDNNNNYNY